ncbi:hypothetical protein NDN16_05000 [Aureimonas altamirensis]|uniref:hypothetical protein n=1 Tax=Aureimonas altamirensis TaxID=370622 RepID=UPI002036E4AD|nr:hypothetical protein [Aureimonas altamirensis]MCM2503034.1 hypothetical protein [Aureimonas altamirensis]
MRWQPHNPVSGVFDMVRVIAMSQHADRRREFSAQLRRLGLSPEVLPDLVHEAVAPQHPSGIRPQGTGARLQAHRDVVNAFLASGRGSLLLIQDDAVFPGAERSRIAAVLQSLSQQRWDLFFGEVQGLSPGRSAVSVLDPDGPAGQCQVVGISRAAAVELSVFLRSWPGHDQEGDALSVEAAYQVFRRTFPGFTSLAACPRVVLRRSPSGEAVAAARLPLMSTFLSLGRRAREIRRGRKPGHDPLTRP